MNHTVPSDWVASLPPRRHLERESYTGDEPKGFVDKWDS